MVSGAAVTNINQFYLFAPTMEITSARRLSLLPIGGSYHDESAPYFLLANLLPTKETVMAYQNTGTILFANLD